MLKCSKPVLTSGLNFLPSGAQPGEWAQGVWNNDTKKITDFLLLYKAQNEIKKEAHKNLLEQNEARENKNKWLTYLHRHAFHFSNAGTV